MVGAGIVQAGDNIIVKGSEVPQCGRLVDDSASAMACITAPFDRHGTTGRDRCQLQPRWLYIGDGKFIHSPRRAEAPAPRGAWAMLSLFQIGVPATQRSPLPRLR